MSSALSSTKDAWIYLNFTKFQSEIEVSVGKIAAYKKESQISKKKLVELVLEFRRTASDEAKQKASLMLKSFQVEVDRLTTRSQTMEDEFVEIYRRLAEMPDPSIALEEAFTINKRLLKNADLEFENKKLRENLEELKNEILTHKSNELLLNKAESRIAELETSMVSQFNEDLKIHRLRLENEFSEKHQEITGLLQEANNRLAESEKKTLSLCEALKSAQSHVFDLRTQIDDLQTGKSLEVHMLLNDVEKAYERIAILEQNKEERSIPCLNDNGSSIATEKMQLVAQINDLELEIEQKKKIVDESAKFTKLLEQKHQETENNLQMHLKEALEALKHSEDTIASLQNVISQQSDYSTIKEELAILQTIEFSEDSEIFEKNNIDSSSIAIKLKAKNERLQNKIAAVNAEKETIEADLITCQEALKKVTDREKTHTSLISKLEADVFQLSSWRRQNDFTNNQSVKINLQKTSIDDLFQETTNSENWQPDENSILTIIQSQRDRFRDRTRDLEENMLALRQQILAVQVELEAVRQDNNKLYEKIKFVQSYSPTTAVASKEQLPSQPTLTTIAIEPNETDVLNRYSRVYEARLNPFEQFGQNERHKRYQDLNPHEKLVHGLVRTIINHRGARLSFFIYSMALHLLVFLVLYKLAHSSNSICPNP